MRQTRYQKEEIRLEAEKRMKYKGTARIKLEWLHFRWNEPRELDSKNVEKLKLNFQRDCCRLDIHNHIPALINQQDLDAATQASEVSAQSLLSNPQGGYPELIFPTGYQLECLHGRHRIQAAKEVLLCGDKWWTVDLYLADVNSQLKTCLIEEYSNEEKPADGEIYRKIRQYHFQRNLSFERRWWTRLTPHGSKNLKQLFRHDELTAAFDALLDIPGLWGGMRISTLHKIMAIRCDEEILCYLDHIREVWFTLLGHNKNAMRMVDQATVKSVELQAPWASTLDAKTLRGQVLGGEIFDRFNEQERVQIWSRLQAVDGLIPSLFTLFEDVKYLEICADCVKQLVSLSPRDTVSTALQRAFSGATQRADQAIMQVAKSSFASRPAGSADRVDLSCRQLYAYAMRHYLDMPKESNGNDLLARLTIKADKTVLRGFADLADRLGFESPKITALKRYPRSTAAIISSSQSNPLLITDGPGEPKKRRCGLPRKENYENNGIFLFLDNLHDDKKEQADGITSFFIRKSVYLHFHGRAESAAVVSTTGGSSLPHCSTIDMITHPDLPTYRQLDCDGPQAEYDYMEEGTDRTQGENEQGQLEREKEQGRLAGLEQERLAILEQERREQERQEQVRLEQERQEQERREQERWEQERWEQERWEQEKLEQEKLEQEKLEQEKLEQEKLEQEKLEQEKLKQEKLEQERREQERLARLKEEKLEQERQDQEKKEQEKLEQERLEQERQEEERQENEPDRQEQQRLGQENLFEEEIAIQEDLIQAKGDDDQSISRVQADKLSAEKARTRMIQIDLEKAMSDSPYRDGLPTSTSDHIKLKTNISAPTSQPGQRSKENSVVPTATITEKKLKNTKVCIKFKAREKGVWKDISVLEIDPFDPSEVERVAKEMVRNGMRLFDTELRLLAPQECYQEVVSDGTNTILLIPNAEMDINDELMASASNVRVDALSNQERLLKRVATDNISQLYHIRKKQNVGVLK